MDYQEINEVVAGLMITGRLKKIEIEPDNFLEPYKKGMEEFNQKMSRIDAKALFGVDAVNSAVAAADTVGKEEDLTEYVSELSRKARSEQEARQHEKTAKELRDGNVVSEVEENTIVTGTEIMETASDTISMVLPDVLSRYGTTIIGGDSGVGKSWMVFDSLIALCSNQPGLWGLQAEEPKTCALFPLNMPEDHVGTRIKQLMSGRKITKLPNLYVDKKQFYLDTPTGLDYLERLVNERQVSVVAFDMIVRYILKANLKEMMDAERVFADIRNRLEPYACMAIYIHHGTKSHMGSRLDTALGGAIQIAGEVDYAYEPTRVRGKANTFKMWQIKNRNSNMLDPTYFTVEDKKNGGRALRWGSIQIETPMETVLRLVATEGEITNTRLKDELEAANLPIHSKAMTALIQEIEKNPDLYLDKTKRPYKIRLGIKM